MASDARSGARRNGDDLVVLRLRAISEEAAHLASTLSSPGTGTSSDGAVPEAGRTRSPEEVLKLLIEMRRTRFRHFSGLSFTDPGWDMLLDLIWADIAGRAVPVSSACVAAGVPATTALRWVNILEKEGFVRRVPDPADRRRVLVEMTADGRRRMDVHLQAIARLLA